MFKNNNIQKYIKNKNCYNFFLKLYIKFIKYLSIIRIKYLKIDWNHSVLSLRLGG